MIVNCDRQLHERHQHRTSEVGDENERAVNYREIEACARVITSSRETNRNRLAPAATRSRLPLAEAECDEAVGRIVG